MIIIPPKYFVSSGCKASVAALERSVLGVAGTRFFVLGSFFHATIIKLKDGPYSTTASNNA